MNGVVLLVGGLLLVAVIKLIMDRRPERCWTSTWGTMPREDAE